MKNPIKNMMMKIALSAVMTMIAASAANACIGELQFIGKASNVENCQYNITFTYAAPNGSCRLEASEVTQKVKGYCEVKEGDEVSGVLVKNADGTISQD